MDGIKLNRWHQRFLSEVNAVQMQYDSYFRSKNFDDCFVLNIDETSETLNLEIIDPQMPNEVKSRLEDLLLTTMPEDSV